MWGSPRDTFLTLRNLNGGQITLSAITPPGVACLSDLVLENVGYSPPRIAGLLSEIMESWGLGGRCGHERKNRLVGMHVSRNKTRRAERRSRAAWYADAGRRDCR